MNVNKTKKYKLSSNNNNYILCFSSFDENDIKKLNIRITHNNMDFNTIKTLEQIKNENKCLFEYNTINSLIDYFSLLTKRDCISIDKKNKLLYNLTFFNENNIMRFYLKRELEQNEKSIKIMEEEIISMYDCLENIKTLFESKIENLKNDYEKKIKNLELKINNKNHYESTFNTNNNQKSELKSSLEGKNCINIIKEIYRSSCLEINSYIDNNNDNNINNNYVEQSYMNNNVNESNFINIKQSENIFKDNNNIISFKDAPITVKEEKIINKEKEECDIFTAFKTPNNVPIIAWTIKKHENNPHSIYVKNMNTKTEYHIEAHKKLINCLQYFHNENIQENEENNFIISLSKNDDEMLKFWKIVDELELQCVKSLYFTNQKIECFCTFNNKNYSKQNSYLFYYNDINNYDNNKNINYSNLNNNFDKVDSQTIMHYCNKVNYLDIYYSEKKRELYLINCNENNVNVITNPLNNLKTSNFRYKDSFGHQSGFIVERNKHIELFESNNYGIFIWDIDNNINPIFFFQFNYMIYDMCLWNDYFLCASTSKGFYFIHIENDEGSIMFNFGIENPSITKKSSKVRKISSSEEYNSIVGINSNKKLCLWPIECKHT